ncbi:hypothetical protein AUC68_08105 [Methyloceanibacter methanicus]|uniref:SMODS and SLOG-associating 2TM effector domain-containing protein n=1 Tax=Methyloceanibacter methanicus TaxID=1774968 RepID=A0A1E3VZS0_9HYPH|nr:hypothetical protein AUC68_08105 [Methyloceanibacter methanicus]
MQFAIDDARQRHAALTELIYFTDSQAMALLRLYSTVGIAMASASAALFAADPPVSTALAWALASATVVLVIGAVFCWLAMQTLQVSLPGRGAEFWLWAMDARVTAASAFTKYLENLEKESVWNREVNDTTSQHLMAAKIAGVLAPAFAFGAGLLAAQYGG